MTDFNWKCSYCKQYATITNKNYFEKDNLIKINSAKSTGETIVTTKCIICPNPQCREMSIDIDWYNSGIDFDTSERYKKHLIESWSLNPNSDIKKFPSYIPEAIREDYIEAYLIKDISPKASATLSRRCLQGIIRDIWKPTKYTTLAKEIEFIKDQIDSITWKAIDSIRKIGNIGAHMESDINQIIDVQPDEALLLIELIEIFIDEWYINRNERKKKYDKIIEIIENKESEKNNFKKALI